MFGRILSLAAAGALVVPLTLTAISEAEAKPKWKEGRGWGGPPAWAPAHGYRRNHARFGGYGYGPRQVDYRYGYAPRGYSRW